MTESHWEWDAEYLDHDYPSQSADDFELKPWDDTAQDEHSYEKHYYENLLYDELDDETYNGCTYQQLEDAEDAYWSQYGDDDKDPNAWYREMRDQNICLRCHKPVRPEQDLCKSCQEDEEEELASLNWQNLCYDAAKRLAEFMRKHNGVAPRRRTRSFTRPVQIFKVKKRPLPRRLALLPQVRSSELAKLLHPSELWRLKTLKQHWYERAEKRYLEGLWEEVRIWNGRSWEHLSRPVNGKLTPHSNDVQIIRRWHQRGYSRIKAGQAPKAHKFISVHPPLNEDDLPF